MIRNYTIGFISSILLTAAGFALIWGHAASHHQFPSHTVLFWGILLVAILQLVVQMRYFLHIGRSSTLRDIVMLALAAAIVLLIVGGSLWIMANLQSSHEIPYKNNEVSVQASQD